jgi:hypothetical protein
MLNPPFVAPQTIKLDNIAGNNPPMLPRFTSPSLKIDYWSKEGQGSTLDPDKAEP